MLLMALDSLRIINIAIVVGTTLNLILIFALVAFAGWGVYGALCAGIASQCVIMGMTIGYTAVRARGGIRVDLNVAKRLITGGLKLHMNAIGTLLCTHVNVLIVNHYRATAETAYYQLCTQLLNVMFILPTAVGMVVYTIVSRKGPDEAWPEHRKLLWQSLALVCGVGAVLYIAAPLVIGLLAGEKFMPAVPLLRIMLFTVVGMTFSIVMSSQWIARGLFLQVAAISAIMGVVSVSLSYLLIPRYGMYGAAYANLFTYGMSILINGGMALWVNKQWRRSLSDAA
jgi:O-antigen/teichoic acid export membrane protein